jgi:hypothetical protein
VRLICPGDFRNPFPDQRVCDDHLRLSVVARFRFFQRPQKCLHVLAIDLLEGRMTVGEDTMQNLVAAGVYANGTGFGGKELTGLDAAIPANPLTGVYGGIDRAAWPFWQSQLYKGTTTGGAAISATNINTYMNRLWAKLVRGQNRPDLIVMDNLMWAIYMASLQQFQRFNTADSAGFGFPTVKYMDADVVLDGGLGGFAPATVAYFLDTKYIFFRPHSAARANT